MLDQFQRNIAGGPLDRHSRTHLRDLDSSYSNFDPESYDVILLSLVLSSMPELPNFKKIAELIAPGGMLVVADIDPVYSIFNPFYAVLVEDKKVTLRVRPVSPLEISRRVGEAGLTMSEMAPIGDGNIDYSFITVFGKPERQIVSP